MRLIGADVCSSNAFVIVHWWPLDHPGGIIAPATRQIRRLAAITMTEPQLRLVSWRIVYVRLVR